jgi:hypothetical protein
LSNPKATATNPDFLKAGTAFTGQRSIRIGVRLTFFCQRAAVARKPTSLSSR